MKNTALIRSRKKKYRTEYETIANRILEIEKKIPELQNEAVRIKEHMIHMKDRGANMEVLTVLETFDKDKLATVIESVLVYSEERIEIIWKMDDGFFKEMAGEKEVLALQ